MEALDDLKDELAIQLKKISKDRDFVIGVLSFMETKENAQKMLDYLAAGTYESISDIILESVFIERGMD